MKKARQLANGTPPELQIPTEETIQSYTYTKARSFLEQQTDKILESGLDILDARRLFYGAIEKTRVMPFVSSASELKLNDFAMRFASEFKVLVKTQKDMPSAKFEIDKWFGDAEEKIKLFLTVAVTKLVEAKKAERLKKLRSDFYSLQGEHGTLYVPLLRAQMIHCSLQNGTAIILTGEPSVAKTDIARAMSKEVGREFFHMEMTGLLDPSQLEGQQYIKNDNGVSVMDFKPSGFLRALRAACEGRKVVVSLEEIQRVTDHSCLNPLLHFLSHGEYYCTLEQEVYIPEKGNLAIIGTANIDSRYQFSGNNRKGLDAALRDRFRFVHLPRPDFKVLNRILEERVPDSKITHALVQLWEEVDNAKFGDKNITTELSTVFSIRRMLDLAKLSTTDFEGTLVDMVEILFDDLMSKPTLEQLQTWIKARGLG